MGLTIQQLFAGLLKLSNDIGAIEATDTYHDENGNLWEVYHITANGNNYQVTYINGEYANTEREV